MAEKMKKVPGLRISAQANGFRRAGRAWSQAPQDVALSEFSKAQIEQLRDERELKVEDIEIEVAPQ